MNPPFFFFFYNISLIILQILSPSGPAIRASFPQHSPGVPLILQILSHNALPVLGAINTFVACIILRISFILLYSMSCSYIASNKENDLFSLCLSKKIHYFAFIFPQTLFKILRSSWYPAQGSLISSHRPEKLCNITTPKPGEVL